MKRKGRLEGAVQAGILAYLGTRGDCWYWRSNTGGAKFDKFFVQFGEKGAADIQGLQAPMGRFFGIEVKREVGGSLSEDQRRWGENVTNHGGIYVVARSVVEVEAALGPQQIRIQKVRKEKVVPR